MSASEVIDQQFGILFHDGTRCAAAPIVRTPIQGAGGSVYAQHWYRDPGATGTTGLSDALPFTIGP